MNLELSDRSSLCGSGHYGPVICEYFCMEYNKLLDHVRQSHIGRDQKYDIHQESGLMTGTPLPDTEDIRSFRPSQSSLERSRL